MKLGPYDVGEELARGGMGVVYRAHDPFLDRDLAIKVIRADDLRDPESHARFRREAQIMARLRHPGVVGIHSAGVTAQGYPFLVMDLLPGGSLKARLAQGPLEAREAVRLTRQLAEALAYTHERGVFHRDVKPANVLMGPEGQAVLTDYGLAKLIGEERLTQTGDVLGTPCYMAPEHVRGQSARVGPASDVYSLGATFFHMLTGRQPFVAETTAKLFPLVLNADAPDPSAIVKEIDEALDLICERCLAKAPEERYADMQTLVEELRAWERTNAALPGARQAPLARRRRAWPLASAALALGLVAGGGAGLVAARPVEAARRGWVDVDDLSPELQATYDRAANRLDREDHEGALADFLIVTEAAPLCDAAWLGLGKTRAAQGEVEEALEHFERAVGLDPKNSVARFERGKIFHGRKEYEAAAEAFREALAIKPNAAPYQLSLAICLFEQAKTEEGHAALERARVLDPRQGGYFVCKARHGGASPEEQAKLLAGGVELDPKNEELLLYRGLVDQKAGDHRQAIASFTHALHSLVETPILFLLRARSFMRVRDFTSASTDLSVALELDPEYHSARLERGVVLFMIGEFDACLGDMQIVARDAEPKLAEQAQTIVTRILEARTKGAYTLKRDVVLRLEPDGDRIGKVDALTLVRRVASEREWAMIEVATPKGPLRGYVPANALLLSLR